MKKILLSILFIAFSSCIFAQEMSISAGPINACEGFLVDPGLSASNDPGNSNFTTTITAVAPETISNLYFALCDLQPGDYIEIFDGPNSSAPLLGTYTASQLQSQDITSSNASGALTVHFVSGANGGSNFVAEISCGPPCTRPFAVVHTNQEPTPILLCPGETVIFDASQSTFAPGMSMQSVQWIFDDGTTSNAGWPNISHTFAEPGGYVVQLSITDNNNCTNNNLIDYVVLVSTYPHFDLMSPSFDLCQGGAEFIGVNLFIPDSIHSNDSLNSWISEPWIDLPHADFGGALYIPDDQTNCFSDELSFSNFQYNAVINSVSDLDNFYINFEHSFMGDITITFICPNGQSIAVHTQGGSGTYLGEPIDGGNETAGDSPGVGWDYYWAPDATLGTWADEVTAGNLTGSALSAGTYSSVQPFSNLIGCPLNGTWTVQICDAWGADDGYIFDWSVAFNPQLYGDILQFDPIYGADCDSSFWTGPNIISQSEGCDFIQIQQDITGTYHYAYEVTNNFGCTFDTTIVVNVFVAPQVYAGLDTVYSCNPLQLHASLQSDNLPICSASAGSYTQCLDNNSVWSQSYCPDTPGDGVTYMTVTFTGGYMQDFADALYIYDGPSTGSPLLAGPIYGNLAGIAYTATNAQGCITLYASTDSWGACADGVYAGISYTISCGGSELPFVWNWTPATSLSDATAQSPTVSNLNVSTTYTVTGYPQGYPGCATSDDVVVVLDDALPSPGLDTDISFCPISEITFDMFAALDGNPETGGVWYSSTGAVVDSIYDPITDNPGSYFYTINSNGCVLSTELLITVADPLIQSSTDTTICQNGSAHLMAWSTTDFNNSYVYHWSTGTTGTSIDVAPTSFTSYDVYASDPGGCTTDTLTIHVANYLPLTLSVNNDTTICQSGTVNATAVAHSGGHGTLDYVWRYNNQSIGNLFSVTHSPTASGQYCLTMSDACESTPQTACFNVLIEQPVAITIDADTTNSCSPLVSQLSLTTDPSLYQNMTWSIDQGTGVLNQPDYTTTLSQVGNHDVSVVLQSQIGCYYTQDFPDYLTVWANPTPQWYASPQPTNIENTLIQFSNATQGDQNTYFWIFDTENYLGTSEEVNPSFEFPRGQGGEYEVSLAVWDGNGCFGTMTGIVQIDDILGVYIPNIFTPNNDGINDFISVQGTDIRSTEFEWKIFNRWGELVYSSTDPKGVWTGNYQGSDYFVPDGVYNYNLKVASSTTTNHEEIQGWIIISR
jgi:gliding motility-associated-like protein